MTALPTDNAVTVPSSTFATLELDEDQVTVLSVAFSGVTVTVNISSSPTTISTEFLSSTISHTGTVLGITVTSHVAVLLPSSVVTVIVAIPAFCATTFPSETIATDLSLLVQFNFLFVALSGCMAAISVSLYPSSISIEVLSRLTLVTGTVLGTTVTWHLADFPPSSVITVMVAEPTLHAVTFPSVTDTTELSLLLQVIFLLDASLGFTVAVKIISSSSASTIDE